ncbi:hypothetical protein AMECASPLE_028370 [Ameca splendens]|uniref:Uncharacterized protein n=1 Tax=Ameca splendens TaxID=208324 RepID=A0ABV0ZRN1_9TELE
MESVFNNEYELSSLHESISAASARNGGFRSRSGEDKVTPATHAVKLYKLVAVIIGVICVLQAALNISFCLVLYLKAGNKTLTEEVDELRISLEGSEQRSIKEQRMGQIEQTD